MCYSITKKKDMEELKNKSIRLTPQTIKKIHLVCDITGLKQGEVIDEAIKKFYPEAMQAGAAIQTASEYLIKQKFKYPAKILKFLKTHYNLGQYKSDTNEEKEKIYKLIDENKKILSDLR